MKARSLFFLTVVLVVCCFGMAGAQEHSFYMDFAEGEYEPGRLAVDTDVQFHMHITATGSPNCMINASIGLQVYSEDGAEWTDMTMHLLGILIDTIYYSPDPYILVTDTIDFGGLFAQYFIEGRSITGSGADSIGFSGLTLGNDPAVYDGLDTNVFYLQIHPTVASHRKHICLDLAREMQAFEWEWTGLGLDEFHPCDLGEFEPDWYGPYCFEVFDSTASDPSNLVISEDSLFFTSVQGQANPPAQTFEVNSDLDPLDFTLDESSAWLMKSPSDGTTPQTISVSINNFGMTEGVYFDSIAVIAPDAVNSPQYVYVQLTVQPPPPEIGVSTTDFFFAAIVDGDNPADQYLDIDNIGGSVLNWTVSNSESWLELTPGSGTNSGTVTLSVDITGLGIGDFFDTIVVSDPAAVNDPVEIEVWLSVASGLPEIMVDPGSFYVVVDLVPDDGPGGEAGPLPLEIPPVTLNVMNGGAGVMNYWIEETSAFISGVTPDAGGVPQAVEIEFEIYGSTTPGDYFDTIWVYSSEATNSPFPVPIAFHLSLSPPEIAVDRDLIVLDMYQCMDGTAIEPIPELIEVTNLGDEWMIVQAVYDSGFVEVIDYSNGVIPATFGIYPAGTEVPPGTYYDTVWITAVNAINSPYPVVIQCNVLPATEDPEIGYFNDHDPVEGWIEPAEGLVFAVHNDGTGPRPYNGCWILNKNYGCMEWELAGGPPWAVPSHLMGSTPHHISFIIDPTGYAPGTYVDTLIIVSPGATNSPRKVPMTMHVWELLCDMNFDGRRTLSDISFLISYVFRGGPAPFPEMAVGNCDCQLIGGRPKVTLADITHLINYVFRHQPNPCLGDR